MAQKSIRFGVIGCGLMGREFASSAARWLHLNDAPARPEIVAVCDTDTRLMDWFGEHVPSVTQKTADYRELLANRDVDAVYCAVPHVLHAEIYPQIIAAGKHFLGEKPFGMDLEQNRIIQTALDANPDALVRCSSEMPFFPGAQRVMELARSGEMGEILEVEASFLHSSDIDPNKVINWKRIETINGNYGCMGDLGMHVLHIPLRLGWRPDQVSASLVKRVSQRPNAQGDMVACNTWDNATITANVPHKGYEFPMVLKTWRISPGDSNSWSLRILGMKKSAFFSTKNPRQWQWMNYESGGDQVWQVQDLGYQSLFPAITGGIFEFGFADAIQQMWAAFLHELAGGNANGFHCATPQEASDHHAILTAALQAGLSRQTVRVDYAGATS